jgi:hypothetical protein
MDDNARLQLQKMIKANNVEDQTDLIRQLKHSHILRENINNLLILKKKYGSDAESIHNDGMIDANFLFTYYTDIYNKIRKDEIDLNILFRFIDVLQKIEDGEMDQHEGSFSVGTLLKELYVDSALRKADKLEQAHASEPKEEYKKPQVEVSWKNFKKNLSTL